MRVPDYITGGWMHGLANDNLLLAESRLHTIFAALEKEQKSLLGAKYDMMRGPAELLAAWDRWARLNAETRNRGLNPRRKR